MARFGGTKWTRKIITGVLSSCLLMGAMSGCALDEATREFRRAVGLDVDDTYLRLDAGTIEDPFNSEKPSIFGPMGFIPNSSNTGGTVGGGNAEPTAPPFGGIDTPGVWVTPKPDDEEDDVDPEASASASIPKWEGKQNTNPENFQPSSETVAQARDYATYLDLEVCEPILALINDLPVTARNHLYFRVYSVGQDYDADKGTSKTSDVYTRGYEGSFKRVGGTAMQTFITQWLGQMEYNSYTADARRQEWLSQLATYDLDDDLTWLEASDMPNINRDLLLMWGNERTACETFGEYKEKMEEQLVGTVPNVKYRYYTSPNQYSSISLNSTSNYGNKDKHYVDGMAKDALRRVFSSTNQFGDRSAETISTVYSDESSVLNCYLDGYNKTLIYIGVEQGYTLSDVLGSASGSSIISTISGACLPCDIGPLRSYLGEGMYAVPAGTKGVD